MIEPLPLACSDGSPEVRASPVLEKRPRALLRRDADVEAAAIDRVFALFVPGKIAPRLVVEVPADAGDAVGQGQGHARIVGPLVRGQTVRAAATVAGHLGEAARRLELDGGTEGIADGEAEEGSTLAIG